MGEQEELEAIYAEAWDAGIWIKEYAGLTGAGDRRDLEALAAANKLTLEETLDELPLGFVVDLGLPGEGDTRVEKCRSAFESFRAIRDAKPDEFPRLMSAREKAGLPRAEHTKMLGTF